MTEIISPISIGIETAVSPPEVAIEVFKPRRLRERERGFEHDPARAYHLAAAEAAFRLMGDHEEMLRDRPLSEKLKMFAKMYFSAEVNRSLAREMEVRGGLLQVHQTVGAEYDAQ